MSVSGNYKKEQVTIDLVWANVFGLLILIPILLIYVVPYYFIWKNKITIGAVRNFFDNTQPESALAILILFLIIFVSGIVLHELIHGIIWSFFAKKGFKSIKFGILRKMLTPYCHCKEPLSVKQYITGAITPAIFLGFIPAVIAIVTGNMGFLIFGVTFTTVAAGDFLIIYSLRKEKADTLVEDHPSEAGCYVYRKIEE